MKFKVYKRRGWARRIAAKYEWHLVEECFGGFTIRPMTPEEKRRSQNMKAVEEIEINAFREEIPRLMESGSILHSLLRKS
jgi:hypothetical protein